MTSKAENANVGSESAKSLSSEYFDRVYAAKDDPWDFASSEYERDKYADTLASLPRPNYARAFEVGCSIGVLTAQLAQRCDDLLSVDVSEQALDKARQRCSHLPSVHFERMSLPAQQPAGSFELIVISEVAYYWGRADLERAMDVLAAHHAPGGDLILVHWTPPVHDYPLTGDTVHELWLARPEWQVLTDRHQSKYRLSVLRRIV